MTNYARDRGQIFIETTFDEPLCTIRARLLELDKPGEAYVLIRVQPGQFAVISGYGLSKLVNELEQERKLGLQILETTLGQLRDHFKERAYGRDILPPQPGVERSSISERKKVEEARKHQNLLLLLEGGQPASVFDNTSPGIVLSGYNLLAKPIPQTKLDKTTWLPAKVHNTVAYVLDKLLKIPDQAKRDEAFVIVRTGTQQFKVLPVEALRQAIQADPAKALNTALISYQMRSATVVDYDLTGDAEAANILKRTPYVVVTRNGELYGLLVRKLDYRIFETASPPSKIWDLSADDIQHALHEITLDQPREVLPRFEDKGNPYSQDRALVYQHTYQLKLSIGRYDEAKSELPTTAREELPSIPPDEEGGSNLYVSLISNDFEFDKHTQLLRLPAWGDSQEIGFEITPTGSRDRATLIICLYYHCNVVQVLEMSTPIVTSAEQAPRAGGREWVLKAARTTDFVAVQDLSPKELSLVITREGENGYLFTFSLDPDEIDAAAWPEIRLGCRVKLTRDDLTHLITKARRQLYNVVRTFDLLQDHDVPTYRKATRALAQVGRQLYLKLFESDDAQPLKDWMEESLPDGSTLQIVDLAGDFVFPWSLVYTAPPWADDKPVDVQKFWGWRYKVVILTGALLDTYCQAPVTITTDDPLRVSVGFYERLKGIKEQKEFFANLGEQTDRHVSPEILTNRRKMSRALESADRDLYYFYCHGYTERIATDIQLDADLVGHFAQLAAENLETRSESLRDHLDDLFDVSDSWMRLTRGKLPLTMLKETVPDRFSRHPIVFMNMCESAQVLPSLSDGFVPFFIERGARAVIGTECSMNTIFADDFARAFLTHFFQGESMGDTLLALRRHYLEEGNPLALAYTMYCDADLRLSKSVLPVNGVPAPPME